MRFLPTLIAIATLTATACPDLGERGPVHHHNADADAADALSDTDTAMAPDSSTDPDVAADLPIADTAADLAETDSQPECAPLPLEQVATLMAPVDTLIELMESQSYMSDILGLDATAIRADAEALISCGGDDPELAQLTALAQAMRAYRNGHSGLISTQSSCYDLGGADASTTRYGVCAKPYADHFVVANQAGTSNPLGLALGERVTAVNGIANEALTDWVMSGPLCGNGAGNAAVRHEHAAAALFNRVRPGDILTVVAVNGQERTVTVGPPLPSPATCRHPAGPFHAPMIEAELRPDGVAVMRLRRFHLLQGEPGWIEVTSNEDLALLLEAMIGQIQTAFETVAPQAVGIIWDVRGNTGGASPVGFEIAAGMPGAVSVPIARCTTRIPDSDPVAYYHYGPNYDLQPTDTFAFDRPTAVLTDGTSISAADYFARAVALGTDAMIFGRPTAGAYGGGGVGQLIDDERGYYLSFDPFRCNDIDGTPLETQSVQPHVEVDVEPADLAAGIDTIEETAAAWILAQQ